MLRHYLVVFRMKRSNRYYSLQSLLHKQDVKAAFHHVAHLRFPLQHADNFLAPTYHRLLSPLIPTPFVPHQQQIALMANHRSMQEMSRLEDLQLQRELKQSVLGMSLPTFPLPEGAVAEYAILTAQQNTSSTCTNQPTPTTMASPSSSAATYLTAPLPSPLLPP